MIKSHVYFFVITTLMLLTQAAFAAEDNSVVPYSSVIDGVEVPLSTSKSPIQTNDDNISEDGWVTILNEGFEESSLSAEWKVYTTEGYSKSAYWSVQNNNSFDGSGSVSVSSDDENINTWLVYGPFDLSDASAATVNFDFLNKMGGNGHFMVGASIDGNSFFGGKYSGDMSEWSAGTLDLNDLTGLGDVSGESKVWLAFNYSGSKENIAGIHIDNIAIKKRTGSGLYTLRAVRSSDIDFSIGGIGVANETWGPGSAPGIRYSGRGNGGEGDEVTMVCAYLSVDDFITDGDTMVAFGWMYMKGIQEGGGSEVSSLISDDFDLDSQGNYNPPVPGGSYYLGLIADCDDIYRESSESNNIKVYSSKITVRSSSGTGSTGGSGSVEKSGGDSGSGAIHPLGLLFIFMAYMGVLQQRRKHIAPDRNF